ncbi:MAG: nucleotidyltransferase family protein, partial [Planctomycetes bacterium]|nr:nucleotidyltransferase family protein [Planctomycetota bacterium]
MGRNTPNIIHDDLLLELVSDLLKEGKKASFIAQASSMSPVVESGDRITIEPVIPEQLKLGAVTLYFANLPTGGTGMVISRLKKIDQNGNYIFHGDACPLPDPPVEAENIAARVVAVTRNGKDLYPGGWAGTSLERQTFTSKVSSMIAKSMNALNPEKSITYLPVTSGRLLRERDLIQLCLGLQEALEDLEDSGEAARFSHDERPLLPMIIHNLREADIAWSELLPPDAEAIEMQSILMSTQLESALKWINETLEKSGHKLMLIQGSALSWHYYPSPHCRTNSDIDSMAEPSKELEIVNALLEAGAALASPRYGIRESLIFEDSIRIRLPGKNWPHLHIHLYNRVSHVYPRRLSKTRMWSESETLNDGDAVVFPKREACFLQIISNIASHLPSLRLQWAVDMSMLAEDIDWDKTVAWIISDGLALPAAVIVH